MSAISFFLPLDLGSYSIRPGDDTLSPIIEIGKPDAWGHEIKANVFLQGKERELRNFHRLLGQAIEETWPRNK